MVFLEKQIGWEFDKEKKIGHVRNQFNYKGLTACQFIKTIEENLEVAEVDKLTSVVTEILDQIKHFEKLLDQYCEGNDGYNNQYNYFYQDDNANFWVRLIPVEADYNCYIHIYKK